MKQTIFLVAGSPHTDFHAAQFIRTLRQLNPGKQYSFVGIGGEQMQQEGFESIGVSTNEFRYKPLYPIKNFKSTFIEAPIHPVHAYTHYVNGKVLRKLRPKYDQILKDIRPSAFLTFENPFFMRRFYTGIRQRSKDLGLIQPPKFFWSLTRQNEDHHHQFIYDHLFCRNPNAPVNWSRFDFPHTQVGYEGLFRAYRFLFSRHEKYRPLTEQPDHLYLPHEEHKFPLQDLISELVLEERHQFRQSKNIGDQDTVLFLATGDTAHEIPWSISRTREAIEKFLNFQDIKKLPRESVTLIISVPPQENLKKIAEQSISKQKWPIRVITVNNEDEKFSSMAASDIGIAVNGQIVAECAGFQLPTVILDPEPFIKSYFTSLFNSFGNDLNLAMMDDVFPELIGSSIPMKIALTIEEIYKDPKLRFYYASRYRDVLVRSLNRSQTPAPESLQNKYPTTLLQGYKSGVVAMAETVQAGIDKYEALDKSIPSYKQEEVRIKTLQELGWAKGM